MHLFLYTFVTRKHVFIIWPAHPGNLTCVSDLNDVLNCAQICQDKVWIWFFKWENQIIYSFYTCHVYAFQQLSHLCFSLTNYKMTNWLQSVEIERLI